MITRGFLFFVLAMSCSLFWGCTSYDLKDFNGCEHECVGPYFLAGTAAPLTSKPLTWKYRLAQNSDVPPGKFKFKFDIDPVQSGDILPQQFLFTFTHRSPKGKILLEEEFDVFTRDDGSIPWQKIEFTAPITFHKKESLTFNWVPVNISLPLVDLLYYWDFNDTEVARIVLPVLPQQKAPTWYSIKPNEYVRPAKRRS